MAQRQVTTSAGGQVYTAATAPGQYNNRRFVSSEAMGIAKPAADRIYNERIKKIQESYDAQEKRQQILDQLAMENLKKLKSTAETQKKILDEIDRQEKAAAKRRRQYEKQINLEKQSHQKRLQSNAFKIEDAIYHKKLLSDKLAYNQKKQQDLQLFQNQLAADKQVEKAYAATQKARGEIDAQQYQKRLQAIDDEFAEREKATKDELDKTGQLIKKQTEAMSKGKFSPFDFSGKAQELSKQLAEKSEIARQIENDDSLTKDEKKKRLEEAGATDKDLAQLEQQRVTNSLLASMKSSLTDALNKITNSMDTYYKYQSHIEARLYGADRGYSSIQRTIVGTLALNPIVKQTEVLNNLNRLVDLGINYNLEERAFLATISDKVATTFDAANGTLLRLIRLQQADTTLARMGMTAALNEFLNKFFEDTSYLSGASSSVSDALIDANALLPRNQSLEFEYIVQKWLGSLSSLGATDQFIQNIAQGINYLATGNVEALAGNDSLQSLLAMSASRAGIPYGEALGNLSPDTTNRLLEEMVFYLKEISQNNSNVVKSAYGNIFNMSQSDLKAISNLSVEDIKTIYDKSLDYNTSVKTAETLINTSFLRMHIGELASNVYENFITGTAGALASNPATYIMWMVNDFVEKATGGINIPAIFGLGAGIDLNANVNQLLKLSMVGVGTVAQIGGLLASLGRGIFGDGLMSSFKGNEFTKRARGLMASPIKSLLTPTSVKSGSTYVGTGSGSDIVATAISSAAEDDTTKINNSEDKDSRTFDDLYDSLFTEQKQSAIKVKLAGLEPQSKNDLIESVVDTLLERLFGSEADTTQFGDMVNKFANNYPIQAIVDNFPLNIGGGD